LYVAERNRKDLQVVHVLVVLRIVDCAGPCGRTRRDGDTGIGRVRVCVLVCVLVLVRVLVLVLVFILWSRTVLPTQRRSAV